MAVYRNAVVANSDDIATYDRAKYLRLNVHLEKEVTCQQMVNGTRDELRRYPSLVAVEVVIELRELDEWTRRVAWVCCWALTHLVRELADEFKELRDMSCGVRGRCRMKEHVNDDAVFWW